MTSSAFFPPEIARFEIEKASGLAIAEVIADERLDMWHFGLMVLQVSTKESPTLFQSTQADNMLHFSDMQLLAYEWDMIKLERVGASLMEISQESRTKWVVAMDLALWCLQGDASRRPGSMEAVFKHRLFDLTGEL